LARLYGVMTFGWPAGSMVRALFMELGNAATLVLAAQSRQQIEHILIELPTKH